MRRLASGSKCWFAAGLSAAALSGCSGHIGDSPTDDFASAGAQQAVVSGARRLSRTEYDNTLRDLLNDTSRSGFAKLPEDVNDPFDNDYKTQLVSPALIEAAETLATEASARALANPDVVAKIVPCKPAGPDDAACLKQFIATFGRRALRRPLAADEVDRFAALQSFAVEGGDFFIGVDLVLRAMLQDLEFLYRVEIGTPVPSLPGVFKLGDFEIATRLSFFLLGTTPPDALLDLAQGGTLHTPDQIHAAAATLLTDPRARDRVDRFHALWLGYHQLPHPPDLTAAMQAESAALVEKVVFDEPSDYFDLFRSDETFVNDLLADNYGLKAPGTTKGAWVSYAGTERKGILSHGSVLSAFSKFADTSPTQRGIFVRTRLLCETVPKPPPNVDADNPPTGGATDCKIDKYAQHRSGGCASCHGKLDPIGFGLENYDKQGRYRTHDDDKPECPISGDGTVEGLGDFHGPGELADLVIASGGLEKCLVRQVYRFAMGRREKPEDDTLLDELGTRFKDDGHAFDQLLIEVVSSESFGFRKQEQ